MTPASRQVAEDAAGGRGSLLARWMLVLGIRDANATATAYAYADANADAYADADADANADAYANANAFADADAYANADDDAADDAAAYAYAFSYAFADANANANADANAYETPIKEHEMRNGIYAVTLPQGSLSVIRVGWFARDEGDEWRVWWATPYRDGYATRPGEVWPVGPSAAPGWTWSPVSESYASRLHFVPLAKLDPAKWGELFPQPTEWTP